MNIRLVTLIQQHALQHGIFPLSSGKISNYYIDIRKITLLSYGAMLVAKDILNILESRPYVTAIGGPTIGADPIIGATLALTAMRGDCDLCGFIVRKTTKEYGTKNLIEGPLTPGSIVIIIDDVATTGKSMLQAIEAVQAIGCIVDSAIVVVDRLEGAQQALAAQSIPLISLLTITDLGLSND